MPARTCPIKKLVEQIGTDLQDHDVQIVGGCGVISRHEADVWVWSIRDDAAVETVKAAAGVSGLPGWLMHVEPQWGDWEVWQYPGHS